MSRRSRTPSHEQARAELLAALDWFRARTRERKAALHAFLRQMAKDLRSDEQVLDNAEVKFAQTVDPNEITIGHEPGNVFVNWSSGTVMFDPREIMSVLSDDFLPSDDVSDAKSDIDGALSELEAAIKRDEEIRRDDGPDD